MSRPVRLVTADRMRALEARCFALGLPAVALMESAGRAVAARALMHAPRRVCVVCGKGNNGADGMVAARALHAQGVAVQVIFAAAPLSNEARLHARLLGEDGVPTGGEADIARADLVIDALLGIGARQPLSEEMRRVVTRINEDARQVLAVDVPSGICEGFDDDGLAVRAHETVSFHAHKHGLAMLPARAYAGTLFIADIGIPDALFHDKEDGVVIDRGLAARHLFKRTRSADMHKGTFGHVAVLGGAKGSEGAQRLASLAALRAGAGLVTALGLPGCARAREPEIMHASATASLKRYSALCLGPGLGRSHDALLAATLQSDAPAVVDADALNALAGRDLRHVLGPGARVLTPHPLEFSRLFGGEVKRIQRDRIAAVRRAAVESGACVVLKGVGTVIAAPDGRYGVCSSGGPELAKGGSGDVLAGIIAAFLGARPYAQDTFVCAALGAYVHGAAGAFAAEKSAPESVLASDVVAQIATTMREISAWLSD